MSDRDLTPAEARAEVEAFMGESWTCDAFPSFRAGNEPRAYAACGDVRVLGGGPTYRAAVSALKAAWRDAVRPWVAAGAQAGYDIGSERGINLVTKEACVARVLKEESNG